MKVEEKVKLLFQHLGAGMCEKPDGIHLDVTVKNNKVTLTVQSEAVDHARLIGAKGKNYNCLCTLLDLIGDIHGQKIYFVVVPPDTDNRPKPKPFVADENWDTAGFEKTVKEVNWVLFEEEAEVDYNHTGHVTYLDVVVECAWIEPGRFHQIKESYEHLLHAVGKNLGRYVFASLKKK